jgi:hypothetical protein
MSEILLCLMIRAVPVCSPAIGGLPPSNYERVEKIVCPDCAPEASVASYRGKDRCLITVNESVVASARIVRHEDFSQVGEFIDASVVGGVLIFSSPQYRGFRTEIRSQVLRCLGKRKTKQ